MNMIDEFFLPYFEGKSSLEETCNSLTEFMNKVMLEHTFTCKICNQIIPPKIFWVGKRICIESNRAEIKGELGNEIVEKDICAACYKKLTLKN